MLRIRLLGAVGALVGSDELALGGPRSRALLALLALAAPRACTTGHLVDGLWGSDPPATARNAVQVYITGLRKVLQPHDVTVERMGDGYALRGSVVVDVATFEEAISAGRTALRSGDVQYAQATLAEAIGLWQGPPFGGLGDLTFATASERNLESLRAAALADLAEAHLRSGDPAAAIRPALILLQDHPFDERGWISLASAYYWSGQQDEALAACRRARKVLRDELGIDPTEALAEIERQILTQEVPDRTSSAAAAASGASAADPPAARLPALPDHLVGRDAAVDEVCALLESGARLVTLVGIGGIGKTTLALAVAHRLANFKFCSLETEEAALPALTRICRSLEVDADDDPVNAIGDVLADGAIMLDNLEQVAGIGTALDDLITQVPGLVVLATSRRPTGARHERAVPVPPLQTDSAEEMFRERAERIRPGIIGADRGAVTKLCALLDGIPLALELAAGRIRTLTPEQLLVRIEDCRASVLDPSSSVALPDRQASLDGVLLDAFNALSGPARRVFELLGSVDGLISVEFFEAATAGLVPDPLEALGELAGCGLVTLDLDGRFSMRGPIREFAHARGPRVELDARILHEAARLADSAATHLFGPDSATTLERLHRDEDCLDLAVSRAVASADHASAAALALGLNRFWLLTGRLTEGRTAVEQVAAMPAHTVEDAAQLGLLAGTYASYFDDPATPVMLTEALARAESVGLRVDRLVVNGWCCLAAFAAHHDDVATANTAARTAAVLASSVDDPALVALARDVDGHIASYFQDFERALNASLAGLVDARTVGDTYDTLNLLTDISENLLNLGRNEEALAYSDEAFDLAAHFDPGPILGAVLLVRGFILIANERVPAARGNLLEALRILDERRPDPLAVADCLFALGTCAAQQLETSHACRLFGAANALYADRGLTPEERHTEPLREAHERLRHGLSADRYATLSAIGASDPSRTVEMLLR